MQHDLGKHISTEYSVAGQIVTDREVWFRTGIIALCYYMYCWAMLSSIKLDTYPESPFSSGFIRLPEFHQHMQDVKTGHISTFYSINYCLN